MASEQLCLHYSLADIQIATQNFDDELVIGQGGFGKVYRGHIKMGEGSNTIVAIKRLDSTSNQGAPEFRAEIEMLSKLRHSHLVSLLGCCHDGKEMIIVYEYMAHGTVHHHLHKSNTPLSWMQRLKITIGAARGLDYLHTGAGTKDGVIHRDVKTSNILLDEDWEAKISDFGLAKICPTNQSSTYVNTRAKGTFGYLDPHSVYTGKVTRKADVFAFGVVLFELLSRRLAVFPGEDEDLGLASWAQKCVKKGNLDQVVDAEIRGQLSPKSLKVFAKMANRCVHMDPKQRPTMSEVVVALELSLALQEKFNNSEATTDLPFITRVKIAARVARGLVFLLHKRLIINDRILDTNDIRLDKSSMIEKESGKKYYMLGARGLSIEWQDDTRYWEWKRIPESRFPEVAILRSVWWLEIRGKIAAVMLSQKTTYAAYLVFRITRGSSGLAVAGKTMVSFGGIGIETTNVYLQPAHDPVQKNDVFPHKRKDGWMEIKLGQFFCDDGADGEVEMGFEEVRDWNQKQGLIVEGIELRPA